MSRYSTPHLKNLIKNWYMRSKGESVELTIFDQFIALWIAFNAWGTHQSKADRDSDMIKWVKRESEIPKIFSGLLDDEKFAELVTQLKDMTPVFDMRPRHEGQKKSISNIGEFGGVLDVIYQIRCNLFHGQKNTDQDRDEQLVKLAYQILGSVFSPVVDEI